MGQVKKKPLRFGMLITEEERVMHKRLAMELGLQLGEANVSGMIKDILRIMSDDPEFKKLVFGRVIELANVD